MGNCAGSWVLAATQPSGYERSMITLILATRNRHKLDEIKQILGTDYAYQALQDYPGSPSIREDADTFEGNARLKAEGIARWLAKENLARSHTWVLADDSGLEVDALQGAPGVRSARFAAEDGEEGNSTDASNNAKLLKLLNNVPPEERTARFVCVLAAAPAGNNPHSAVATRIFRGVCEGSIGFEKRGENGFGYDPLFIPKGYETTFAELSEEEKNSLSHRAQALENMKRNWSP